MKRERVSLGELAFSHLSLPDWAKEKLKHWPWIVFFAGAVLALKIGFGLPVEFKTELPFVEWKDGGASEINGTALAVGVGLMLVGYLCAREFFKKPDNEGDRHWPRVLTDYLPGTAVLFVESPTIVDPGRLDKVSKRFGRRWPPMIIRWPRSSQRLIDEARDVMRAEHRLDLSDQDVRLAFDQLQRLVARSLAMREQCAAALPALVKRCADLPDATVLRAIQRLLVLINYRAHEPLFTALTKLKGASANVTVPKIWDLLFGKGGARKTLYQVDNPLTVKRALLVGIGGSPVFTDKGGVLTVEGKGYDLRHRVSVTEASPDVFAEIEASVIERGGELPDVYSGELLFSKIGPGRSSWLPGDGDVDVDAELVALGETYRREWSARHPEQQP